MKRKNILIFPAGTEIGLEIERSLRNILHFNIIGATSRDDHSRCVFLDLINNIPFIYDPTIIDVLNNIIDKYKIDYIFPAHDDVVTKLTKYHLEDKIRKSVGIIASSFDVCEIARSKSLTYQTLSDVVTTPKMFNAAFVSEKDLPLFAKPDKGQGSRGAKRINKLSQLNTLSDDDIICELLTGEEYTIDCFTDFDGHLRYASARKRARINNGISVASEAYIDEKINEIAKKINSKIKFNGAWFFQLKQRTLNGEYVLLEIAPRIAGAMGFSRAKGVNLPALSIYNHMGINVDIFANKTTLFRDSALMPRYLYKGDFEQIYVDFDDTLVYADKINGPLLGMLYEFRNRHKKIFLITRHFDVHGVSVLEALKKHNISKTLFDEIIAVKKGEKKSSYISNNAVFIDDSCKERFDVHKNCGIDTFTCEQFCEIFRL